MAKFAKRKSSGKRRSSKKTKGLSKKQASAVKKIAKSVVAKTAETKYFQYGASGNVFTNDITSYNLFYHGVNQGTDNNKFTGDKIEWRGIKIKYSLQNQISGTYYDQPYQVKLMIISLPKYVALSSLTLTDIRDDTTGNPSQWFKKDELLVHYEKQISMRPERSGSGVTNLQKDGTIWLSRRQMIEFVDFSVDYKTKNRNYYFIHWGVNPSTWGAVGATAFRAGTIIFNWKNYFKDS